MNDESVKLRVLIGFVDIFYSKVNLWDCVSWMSWRIGSCTLLSRSSVSFILKGTDIEMDFENIKFNTHENNEN